MSRSESDGLDVLFGIIVGLLGGAIAGILLAPKPGREMREDVQNFLSHIPDEVTEGLSRSKVQYYELVDRTRDSLERQMEKRSLRKQAQRMAQAKLREEQEAGAYDY